MKPWRPRIEALLAAEPELTTREILVRVGSEGYSGGKTQLYDLVAELRAENRPSSIRFESSPGALAQHGLGRASVRFSEAAPQRIRFFASQLEWSRRLAVTIVGDESIRTLLRAMVEHYAAFGGVPLIAVFDRPKGIALSYPTKSGTLAMDSQAPALEWDPTFRQVMADLGVTVDLRWPHGRLAKGTLKNLAGSVTYSFFKRRRFADVADLERQLVVWCAEVNSRAGGQRIEQERAHLRPISLDLDSFRARFRYQ